MLLSIIIPVYNEEKTIERLLKKVINSDVGSKYSKQIIVIDDGSTDRTNQKLQKYLPKITFLKLAKNIGKGYALRKGLELVRGEVVIIQDADLEYDPKYYQNLLSSYFEGNEVVFGSRLKDRKLIWFGKERTVMPIHWIFNKFLSWLVNVCFGSNLTDIETGYKLFSRKAISNIELESSGFEIEPEITMKLLMKGIKIVEIPIEVSPRTKKEGKKISWRDGIKAIFTVFKYRYRF